MIELEREEKSATAAARIKVVGVGGAGGNTINCMIESGFEGADFYAVNTDAQALKVSRAGTKVQIGLKSTKGLGAGANPEMGKRAVEEDLDKVMEALSDADIVFVTGGMGGGTGSGVVPVLVKTLKEKGILTIVVVTKPFQFEGKRRARIAEEALEKIKATADTLLIIPNQKLLEVVDEKVSMIDAFSMINDVLNQSVRSISEIITRSGHINVDFADVREIMKDKGLAVMGTARCSGHDRAKKAALQAVSSPLLENMSIAGARSVLLNITGGMDLGLQEISDAASLIYDQVDEEANIILGSVIDPQMSNEVVVTIIATGFPAVQPESTLPKVEVKLAVEKREPVVAAARYESVAQAKAALEQPKVVAAPVTAPAVQKLEEVSIVKKEIVAKQEAHPYVAPIAAYEKPTEMVQKTAAPVMPKEAAVVEKAPVMVENACVVVEAPRVEQQAKPSGTSALDEIKRAAAAAISTPAVKVEKPEVVKVLSEEEEFELLLKEEAELLARKAALGKATGRMPEAAVQMHERTVEEHAPAAVQERVVAHAAVDINDLDIPAFMRKNAKEKRAE